MGMFDYIDYKGPLPKGLRDKAARRLAMAKDMLQTKDLRAWENPRYANHAWPLVLMVSNEKVLTDPNGHRILFTGNVYAWNGRKGCNFIMRFQGGELKHIGEVADN